MPAYLTPRQVAEDAIEIPLSRGLVAIVDADQIEGVARQQWHAHQHKKGGFFYAIRRPWNPETKSQSHKEYMHRVIVGVGPGAKVDHWNGNTLDNRRANLRVATTAQNAINSKLSKANTSGFKGVSFHRKTGRWIARLHGVAKYRSGYIGLFPTREDAARAYDRAALEAHGPFARVNFPSEAE